MLLQKVSSKGSVLTPAELRRHFDIEAGSFVLFRQRDGIIEIVPLPKDSIKALRGSLNVGESATALLEQARREEQSHERVIERRFVQPGEESERND